MNLNTAVRVIHQQRNLQGQLWRLDSPTEAALVAQLWGGQHAEEVVESIGDPQPERPEYRFAGLGPPNMQSEKLRHAYVLGQHHYYCALEMADQQGLLKKRPKQPGQAEQEQQQPAQHSHQQQEPCSPKAATAAASAQRDPSTPVQDSGTACRTPVVQLRAAETHLHDVSPMNNRIRRMAAEIRAGSSALQDTLIEHGRCTRRSTASIRSRASTHSDGSGDDSTAFLASPGRVWLQYPDLQLQDTAVPQLCMHADRGPSLFAEPSSGSSTEGAHSTDEQYAELPHGPHAAATSSPCSGSGGLSFQRFRAAAGPSPQQAAVPQDSAHVQTPRLESGWAPLSSTSHNSSCTQDDAVHPVLQGLHSQSAGHAHTVQAGPSNTATSASLNEQHVTDTGAPIAHAGHATGSEGLDDEAAAAASSAEKCATGTAAEEGVVQGVGCAAACRSAAAGPIAVLALGSAAAAVDQGPSTCPDSQQPQERSDSRLSNCTSSNDGIRGPSSPGVAAQQAAAPGAEDSWHAEGFWSCDDEEDEEQQEEQLQQQPAAKVCAGAGAARQSGEGSAQLGEPCQLPLSPLLLRELSKQLSGSDAEAESGPQAPLYDCSINGDAVAGCDWVTVCSFDGANE